MPVLLELADPMEIPAFYKYDISSPSAEMCAIQKQQHSSCVATRDWLGKSGALHRAETDSKGIVIGGRE